MNTKFNKIVKTAAVGIFFMALLMNVKVSLTDPFVSVSNDALAQTSSSSSSNGMPPTTASECKEDTMSICSFETIDWNGVRIIANAPGFTEKD